MVEFIERWREEMSSGWEICSGESNLQSDIKSGKKIEFIDGKKILEENMSSVKKSEKKRSPWNLSKPESLNHTLECFPKTSESLSELSTEVLFHRKRTIANIMEILASKTNKSEKEMFEYTDLLKSYNDISTVLESRGVKKQEVKSKNNIGMNLKKQEHLFEQFVQQQKEVMFKKGNDYANEDRLSNFKLTAGIAQTTPEAMALQMIATKVVRLGNLLQPGKVPNNESVRDSIGDLANYAFLLDCILVEQEENLNKI